MKKHWVIPDIHGNSKTLRALIEEQIKPMRNDRLCFLGDYIDRGPDAKGVIDYIMKLRDEEYDIMALRGNHEDFLLRTYDNETVQKNILGITYQNKIKKEWFRYGGRETLKSFGLSDVHDIPGKYIDWMRNLDYYIELDGYILVHAGLNFSIENPYDDKHAMLWAKDFKAIPEKIGNRKVVHGHVPVSLEFIDLVAKSDTFDFIDLDNGVYMPGKEGFGNLVAMELTSRELVIQPNLDMD
ncbi:MAG: metallophosphoesterase [Bacteroidales bacterium]|nr:metallophosphoesterase [Bacteroidales bacterium]